MRIIIVGAGVTGLLASLLLAQQGIQATVVDPWAGVYTKEGTLDTHIFETIGSLVGEKIVFSESHHIKDLERALFEIATRNGIHFISADFVGFEKDAVLIKIADKTIQLGCDIAIDASGSIRALVKKINSLFPNTFNAVVLDNDHTMNHLIAYGKLSSKAYKIIESKTSEFGNKSIFELDDFNKYLQKEFHWHGEMLPDFHIRIFPKGKTCIYLEVPNNHRSIDIEKYLDTFLEFRFGKGEHFQKLPVKNPIKKQFQVFHVNPKRLQEPFYSRTSDHNQTVKTVIPLGDARKEHDYRFGVGISETAETIKFLVSSITMIQKDVYQIDLNHYRLQLIQFDLEADRRVMMFYKTKKTFNEAFPLIVSKLKTCLDDKGQIKLDRFGNIEKETRLLNLSLLISTLYSFNHDSVRLPEQRWQLVRAYLEIATKYKELSDFYFNLSKFGSSNYCAKRAIEMYSLLDPATSAPKINELIFRICDNDFRSNNYQQAFLTSVSMLTSSAQISSPKLMAQFLLIKTLALLNLILEKKLPSPYTSFKQALVECDGDMKLLNSQVTKKELYILNALRNLIDESPDNENSIKFLN